MFPPRASSHRESITVPDMRAIQSLRQRFKSFSTMFYIFVCLLEKKKKSTKQLASDKGHISPPRQEQQKQPFWGVQYCHTEDGQGPQAKASGWVLQGRSSTRTGHLASPFVSAVHGSSSSYKTGLFATTNKTLQILLLVHAASSIRININLLI